MMEFHARILIDSQDPEVAYDELRQALNRSDVRIRIADGWMQNNVPLPKHSAQIVARRWAESRDPITINPNVRFETHDPAAQAAIDIHQDRAGEIG